MTDILRTLRALAITGVVELRALEVPTRGTRLAHSGYYDDTIG
jgi:hypothetical protein